MKLWIDTSAVARAEALFGLPPLERLRRSAAKASEGAQVVLSGPGATPGRLARRRGRRRRRAARHAPAPGAGRRRRLVAIDGANVIDPRLIGFLLRSARPARGGARRGRRARGGAAPRAGAGRRDPGRRRRPARGRRCARRRRPDRAGRRAGLPGLRRQAAPLAAVLAARGRRRRDPKAPRAADVLGELQGLDRPADALGLSADRLAAGAAVHAPSASIRTSSPLVSIVFTIAAVPLFARGDWIAGLPVRLRDERARQRRRQGGAGDAHRFEDRQRARSRHRPGPSAVLVLRLGLGTRRAHARPIRSTRPRSG